MLGGAGQPRPALLARAAVLESGDEGAARVRRAATTEMFAISSRALLHRLAQARHVGLRPLPGKWGYFDLISKRTEGGGGGAEPSRTLVAQQLKIAGMHTHHLELSRC